MKLSVKIFALLLLGLLLIVLPGRAQAQSGTIGSGTQAAEPTPVSSSAENQPGSDTPKGVVSGKIVNKNDATKPVSDLEVMLHVLDQNQNELGMLHGKSVKDGSFEIADVPFQSGMGYVIAVVYEGTTYYSNMAQAEAGKTSLNLDVPVYESTTDLSKIQVDQMHVLFSFASDGMDVKQLYALSNLGDRTVKDGIDIPGKNGAKAALQFPLPEKADFVNFQPQDEARFVKFPGGFVDAAPLVPGQMSGQFIVGYLLPYTDPLTFQLKTVLPVQAVTLVVPKESGVKLKGPGLGEPEPVTAQDGQLFYLYKLQNISAGKTLDFTFDGKPVIPKSQTATPSTTNDSKQLPLFIGLGILGAALIGGGAFWWVRSSRREESEEDEVDTEEYSGLEAEFESLLAEIAQLDQCFERGELEEATYREKRGELMVQAKAVRSELAESESVPEATVMAGDGAETVEP